MRLSAVDAALDRLAAREGAIEVFFRDDDGGWADAQLRTLCDWFAGRELPLDIAVIPRALSTDTLALLEPRLADPGRRLGVHQHGLAHVDHQPGGRAAEFGDARGELSQRIDIAAGRACLEAAFGERLDPIFTPPWNRCTADTVRALAALDVRTLSRLSGAEEVPASPLAELSVTIDWLKRRRGERLVGEAFVDYVVGAIEANAHVGVMLHHEHMHAAELELLDEFVRRLRARADVRFVSMGERAHEALRGGGPKGAQVAENVGRDERI